MIVHLTDLHLSQEDSIVQRTSIINKIIVNGYKFHQLNSSFSRNIFIKAIQRINDDIKPDLVVITGDLVDRKDDSSSYKFFYENIQKIKAPYFLVYGDHDNDSEKPPFSQKEWPPHKINVKKVGKYLIIGIPPFPNDADIVRIKNILENSIAYNIIIANHRMIKTSLLMDLLSKVYTPTLKSSKANELLELVSKYSNIQMILTGHSHTNYEHWRNNSFITSTASIAEYPYEMRIIWKEKEKWNTKVMSVYKNNETIP